MLEYLCSLLGYEANDDVSLDNIIDTDEVNEDES